MLEPKNIKEDLLKRCRLSGAEHTFGVRTTALLQNCMQILIQGTLGSTSSSKRSSFGGSVHKRSDRSASSSIVDDDTTFDGGSLYCQQIGIPTSSIRISPRNLQLKMPLLGTLTWYQFFISIHTYWTTPADEIIIKIIIIIIIMIIIIIIISISGPLPPPPPSTTTTTTTTTTTITNNTATTTTRG